jgi:glycosyltransferase involved in cell wall biosynthesis
MRNQLEFVHVLIRIMQRFPSHFHLFAGIGEVRAIRGLLHSEGVLSRMRFLGTLGDATRLMRVIDVGLVAFPDPGHDSILDMMGAGKPIVALHQTSGSQSNIAAELIGERELIARTAGEYTQIADSLIRDVATRSRLGENLRVRFAAEFTPDRLADRYVRFLEKIL